MAHISPLLFPTAAPDASAQQLERPALWAHGISGDLPVWCARPEAHVLRQWALLRALGIGCDLALCTSDGGDYLQPTRTPGASTAGCATRGCCAARRRCA